MSFNLSNLAPDFHIRCQQSVDCRSTLGLGPAGRAWSAVQRPLKFMELNRLLFALQANVYEFVACNSAEIRRFSQEATKWWPR